MTRRQRWLLMAAGLAAVMLTAEALAPPVRGGTGRSLWLGVGAALLVLICALLGLRKRLLRWRLGSIAGWTAAHNGLGMLALAMALAHCQFQAGGVLTSALLITLALTVASGIVGAALQMIVPAMMTARLPNEAPRADFALLFLGYWRQAHEQVVGICGSQPEPNRRLLQAERAARLDGAPAHNSDAAHDSDAEPNRHAGHDGEADVSPMQGMEASGYEALADFYSTRLVAFLSTPSTADPLASASEATLAFANLRGHVDISLYAVIDELEAICDEARIRVQERRLHRMLFGWQLLHIPLSTVTLLLLIAHGVAAIYY